MERADDALDGLNASSDGQGSLVYLFIICAVAAVGGLLFGFDTAIIAGATEFIRVQFELTEFQEGLMAGSLLVGCMIGAGVAGFVSDRLGRKRVLIAAAAFYVVSAICAGLPRNVLELMAARFMGRSGRRYQLHGGSAVHRRDCPCPAPGASGDLTADGHRHRHPHG